MGLGRKGDFASTVIFPVGVGGQYFRSIQSNNLQYPERDGLNTCTRCPPRTYSSLESIEPRFSKLQRVWDPFWRGERLPQKAKTFHFSTVNTTTQSAQSRGGQHLFSLELRTRGLQSARLEGALGILPQRTPLCAFSKSEYFTISRIRSIP
jgi:hypothetical protein